MNNTMSKIKALIFLSAFISLQKSSAQTTDTLRVLSYNVLYLGDTPPCQGPHSTWEGYVKTILSYANADIVGFVKRASEDTYGSAPAGFADSLLVQSFNAAFPGRYAYCPYTNVSEADNISTLYYNQEKLGYESILSTYSNITDFDTYKLYYKSTDLATTHDTIFLYVTLNHTNSGSGSSDATTRGQQIAGEMAAIETHFGSLPNMINMGDFNFHTSTETGYQTLVAPTNLNYRYYDPPFYPDAIYSYPADWDNNPSDYASSLTVSTRENSGSPNSCSSDVDGGKSWYDHIFLSKNIINNADHIGYMSNSFKVMGNDGNRLGISVNSSPSNTSAPTAVINDIFEMSEHYPIMLDLVVNNIATSVPNVAVEKDQISVVNPADGMLNIHFPPSLTGKNTGFTCTDVLGRVQIKEDLLQVAGTVQIPLNLQTGVYYLTFTQDGLIVGQMSIFKK